MQTLRSSPIHFEQILPYETEDYLAELQAAFGVEFTVVDGLTGNVIQTNHARIGGDWMTWGELCRQVAESKQANIIADASPLAILAIPLPESEGQRLVAVGFFLTQQVQSDFDLRSAAHNLGTNANELSAWAAKQTTNCSRQTLERMAATVIQSWIRSQELATSQKQVDQLAGNLANTYEEINLLYRLTQSLKLSQTDDELGRLALHWLMEAIPAESFAIHFLPIASTDESAENRAESLYLTTGPCPLDLQSFSELIANCRDPIPNHPIVLNPPITTNIAWAFPEICQLVIVPLMDGTKLYGWLTAFNHVDGKEFGSVEANLLGSVAAILGIHSSNSDLHRQQSELLISMVRALTSAIDAKDAYTCGHSDRVARVSVRLGRELGCTPEQLRWLYLSGLLHDVGKIGIDQQILHKPGRLTEAEYQHIQTHSRIGHNILCGIKRLDEVLPVVLHHHEAWNGSGYPSRLSGEEIPHMARIAAVADAYDAMVSDRPYRNGMPDDKIDTILRDGSGVQWDARVIAAFFNVRADIRQISDEKRENIRLDASQWS